MHFIHLFVFLHNFALAPRSFRKERQLQSNASFFQQLRGTLRWLGAGDPIPKWVRSPDFFCSTGMKCFLYLFRCSYMHIFYFDYAYIPTHTFTHAHTHKQPDIHATAGSDLEPSLGFARADALVSEWRIQFSPSHVSAAKATQSRLIMVQPKDKVGGHSTGSEKGGYLAWLFSLLPRRTPCVKFSDAQKFVYYTPTLSSQKVQRAMVCFLAWWGDTKDANWEH